MYGVKFYPGNDLMFSKWIRTTVIFCLAIFFGYNVRLHNPEVKGNDPIYFRKFKFLFL